MLSFYHKFLIIILRSFFYECYTKTLTLLKKEYNKYVDNICRRIIIEKNELLFSNCIFKKISNSNDE